ncbi:MAG: HEAT repeat domain-containing protein [Ardenticatenaceae bacterium]
MKRERLEDLLERISEGDRTAHEELLAHIMQQPEGIRVLAFEALNDEGEDTYEELMLTLADDPNLIEYYPAPRQPLDEEAFDSLHIIAQMTENEWRKAAGMGRQPAQPLLDRLRNGERRERIQAARELATYNDSTAIGALIRAIRAGDRLVSAAAVEALQEIGTLAIPALVDAMKDRNEQVRWHAAKALSTTANEEAVPALIPALQDKHYGVRWLAAEGLVCAGRATLIPLFRRLAEGEITSWVRQGSSHVLKKIDVPDDKQRRRYKELAKELKRASSSTIPNMARQELRRLGEDA